MGNYPDMFEGVTHIYDFKGDAVDIWANLASTVTGADLTTDSRGVANNAYDFVSTNSDKIALGDISLTKTVVLRINLDSTTENIFEGSANDKELYASLGTLTYPDWDNVYVDGVDTNTIATGYKTIMLISTTDVDCTAFQLGIINATYGDFTIERMATFDQEKSSYALAFHKLLSQKKIYPFDNNLPIRWIENCALYLNGNYASTTAYDQSGNGNNGTINFTTTGRIGRHTYFDLDGSDDKITVATINSVNAIGFWINADANTKDIIKLTASDKISIDGSNNITVTGFSGLNSVIYVDGTTNVLAGTSNWYYVFITFDDLNCDAIDIGNNGSFDGKLAQIQMFTAKPTQTQGNELRYRTFIHNP